MKKLMELAQAQQVKELEASFEKDNKEMKAAQAKVRIYISGSAQTGYVETCNMHHQSWGYAFLGIGYYNCEFRSGF